VFRTRRGIPRSPTWLLTHRPRRIPTLLRTKTGRRVPSSLRWYARGTGPVKSAPRVAPATLRHFTSVVLAQKNGVHSSDRSALTQRSSPSRRPRACVGSRLDAAGHLVGRPAAFSSARQRHCRRPPASLPCVPPGISSCPAGLPKQALVRGGGFLGVRCHQGNDSIQVFHTGEVNGQFPAGTS
jgi:hypothetical protein